MENVSMLPSNITIVKDSYFVLVIIFSLITRLIVCGFKTLAIRDGESDNNARSDKTLSKSRIFFQSFLSSGNSININDYWLPAIVGTVELSCYPILMASNNWSFIGVWLGIKTAAIMRSWENTRTPFNRFLLGNILILFFSWFFLSQFVVIGPLAYY